MMQALFIRPTINPTWWPFLRKRSRMPRGGRSISRRFPRRFMKVVDAFTLSEQWRAILRPGESVTEPTGQLVVLPQYFYEVPTWEMAKETKLSEHFSLAELMLVDCRENAAFW